MGASLGNLIAGLAAAQMEEFALTSLFGAVAGIVIGSGVLFIIFKGPMRKMQCGVE